MNTKEKDALETQRAVEEFLAKGGKITKLGPEERSEEDFLNVWKRRKPKSKSEDWIKIWPFLTPFKIKDNLWN